MDKRGKSIGDHLATALGYLIGVFLGGMLLTPMFSFIILPVLKSSMDLSTRTLVLSLITTISFFIGAFIGAEKSKA